MFTFRMRAYAAAHFEFDDVLTITWPTAEAKFQSEYTGGEDGRAYPVTIHGEIRGEGDSLDEAEPRLAKWVGNVLPVFALAANAAIADPLAVVAHGLDLTEPQLFRGYSTPDATAWFPPGKRRFDPDATLALAEAVGGHRHGNLLYGAIEAYRRALSHWIPEQRLMAGEFLFISAETLSRFLIESRAAARGITARNLAQLSHVSSPDALRRQYLVDEIFAGDTDAFEAMENASNGFEHGYMSVDDVRGLLEPVLERAMRLVRRGLVAGSQVRSEMGSRLLAENYDEPRGLVPEIAFVTGELLRRDTTQATPEMDGGAVELAWPKLEPKATRRPDGELNFTFEVNVKVAHLPPNASLVLSGFGLRAAHVKLVGDVDAEFTPGGDPDEPRLD
jgi:hypothetical protein